MKTKRINIKKNCGYDITKNIKELCENKKQLCHYYKSFYGHYKNDIKHCLIYNGIKYENKKN